MPSLKKMRVNLDMIMLHEGRSISHIELLICEAKLILSYIRELQKDLTELEVERLQKKDGEKANDG